MKDQQTQAPAIFAKMAAILAEAGVVGRDTESPNVRYKFRSIDQVLSELQPLMAKYGVFHVPVVEDLERAVYDRMDATGTVIGRTHHVIAKVRHRFYAEDGSYVDAVVLGEGADTFDKASNKALVAAQKYALLQAFALRSADDDPDADQVPVGAPCAGGRQMTQMTPEEQAATGYAPPAQQQPRAAAPPQQGRPPLRPVPPQQPQQPQQQRPAPPPQQAQGAPADNWQDRKYKRHPSRINVGQALLLRARAHTRAEAVGCDPDEVVDSMLRRLGARDQLDLPWTRMDDALALVDSYDPPQAGYQPAQGGPEAEGF